MKYMGSKNRIAKHILPIMLAEADKHGITDWVEPMVGGGNMIDKVPSRFRRVGIDINPHVIFAMIDIRDNPEKFPDYVSEETYKSYKGSPPSSITSWARFVCSFGGKFENGYGRSGIRGMAAESKRNALRQSPNIQGVFFRIGSFEEYSFLKNCIIYLDPPYKGTTGYKTKPFMYDIFYEWCRKMASQGNIIFISEYSMPSDFECVWTGQLKRILQIT